VNSNMKNAMPMPKPHWGESWAAPIEDDLPIPADVEMDFDTGRYRHILHVEVYRAQSAAWWAQEKAEIQRWLASRRQAGEQ